MYADNMTDSMKKAIGETNRRRSIQTKYNEENGITPQSVKKDIREIIEITKVAEEGAEYNTMEEAIEANKENIEKTIAKYEVEMRAAAKDLQFERAAQLRDLILKLKKQLNKG
jgi:excinuclease ABC subunit B